MILIILGALLLIGLVVLHELGHFYAARRAGVEVEEFGVGFPPRAKVLTKKNGTEYTMNWLPLGGFVKLKGEHDSDTTKGSYGAAKLKDKVLIMLAGVVVNATIAVLLLSIIALVGLPKVLENQFTVASDTTISRQEVVAADVAENSAASQIGLQAGDRLLSITPLETSDSNAVQEFKLTGSDGLKQATLNTPSDLTTATASNAGNFVEIQIERKSERYSGVAKLASVEEVTASRQAYDSCAADQSSDSCARPIGHLGVVPSEYVEYQATWSAPIVAVVFSGQIVQETFRNFGQIFADLFKGSTETAQNSVTGVVGIGYILGELSSQGFMSVLFLVAIISLSLAIMNALPIPALDGGRLFVTLVFRALKKPLTKNMEERIHGTGFAVLMLLFVLITIVDVQRFII